MASLLCAFPALICIDALVRRLAATPPARRPLLRRPPPATAQRSPRPVPGWRGFNCVDPMKRYCTHKYRDAGFEVPLVPANLSAGVGGPHMNMFPRGHCGGEAGSSNLGAQGWSRRTQRQRAPDAHAARPACAAGCCGAGTVLLPPQQNTPAARLPAPGPRTRCSALPPSWHLVCRLL